jgi:hypothetical protein
MRHSLVVTCLLLTAWADPVGNLSQPAPATPGFSVVEKSTDGRAADESAAVDPPETTRQLIEFDDIALAPPSNPEPEQVTSISGDALAALDAVADGLVLIPLEPVPLPPHRAIPHAQVCEALASAALNNDVPTPFFIRLIWQESGFRQNVVSAAGAQGVAQFMPATAEERGLLDPFNPLQAVRASARFLRELIQQFGNVGLAAAAYNAGPRRVQDWLEKRGRLPQETQNYVERITGRKADEWKAKSFATAPLRVPARAPCQREAGLYAASGPEQIPLPPVPVKDEAVKIADKKPKSGTTKTVSAKSTNKSAKTPARGQTKGQTKDQARIEHKSGDTAKGKAEAKAEADADTRHTSETKKNSAKKSGKRANRGRKVKVADAQARK